MTLWNGNRYDICIENLNDTSESDTLSTNQFLKLNLHTKLLQKLADLGIKNPTPIQLEAIPQVIVEKDLVGIAQTGTGKTLAYALPILTRIFEGRDDPSNGSPENSESDGNRRSRKAHAKQGRACLITNLVLAPTRELALQIDQEFLKLGKEFGLITALLVGGAPFHKQIAQLRLKPQVVVATPGRLEDLRKQNLIQLSEVKTFVLDEADRMLDMGFAPIIRQLASFLPTERQTMMFSATFPKEIEILANELLSDPVRIEVSQQGSIAEGVSQELMVVPHEEKVSYLEKILEDKSGPIIVFARTRHGARKLAKALVDKSFFAAEIHADRTLAQRREAIDGFKSGRYSVLVATDIASRGLDIKDVSMVVNYDLPDQPDDYIHRIGRTARAGKSGRSVTFATPQQKRELYAVENLLNQAIPLSALSPLQMPPSKNRRTADAKNFRETPKRKPFDSNKNGFTKRSENNNLASESHPNFHSGKNRDQGRRETIQVSSPKTPKHRSRNWSPSNRNFEAGPNRIETVVRTDTERGERKKPEELRGRSRREATNSYRSNSRFKSRTEDSRGNCDQKPGPERSLKRSKSQSWAKFDSKKRFESKEKLELKDQISKRSCSNLTSTNSNTEPSFAKRKKPSFTPKKFLKKGRSNKGQFSKR